jgi:RNA polymerase primary sigma factor
MDADTLFLDDPLKVYLYEIDRVPPLGPEEEMSCLALVRTEDLNAEAAAKRLVEAHLGLVVSIAERYRDGHVDIMDLIQSGNAGLLYAVQNLGEFDHDRFSTYATSHIEGALSEAIAKSQSLPESLPAHRQKRREEP